MISLGQRIKEQRMKHRLSQVELAKGICTPSMVSQIESDRARPSYKILSALAERLEVPLEKLLADVDLNADYMSTFKLAQAMIVANEYQAAIPLIEEIMQVKRAIISQDELRIELAECFLHTGQLEKANTVTQRIHESAVLRRDGHMLVRAYRIIGLIEFQMKRFHLAIYHWQKALDEMSLWEIQQDALKAQLLTDLGRAHVQIGLVQDAAHFYMEATSLYGNTDDLGSIAHAYMNLSRTSKQLLNFDQSVEYAQRAITLFETLENAAMKANVQILSAVSISKQGREQEAIQLLEQAIHKLQEFRKHEDLGIAYVELANIQSSIGELDIAEESCKIARGLLPELHPYQAMSHRIMGNIEQQRGNLEESKRRFQMAADCFKSVGEIGEWANTMVELSGSIAAQNDFMSAYRILKEVRSLTQHALRERGIVL